MIIMWKWRCCAVDELLKQWIPNVVAYKSRFLTSLSQTMQMTLRSGAIALVVGLALGVLLTVTKKDGIRPQAVIYRIVDLFVNLFRSIPFIILLIFLIPFTRMLVGTAIGVKGALVPLVFGCVPFYTRQVEAALASVDGGKVEAARSMGSSTLGIIFRVYLHEAVPDLVRATTITAISLIGLTTMAGAGGIGSFAINYGQNQNHQDIVNVCVIILLVFVSLLQFLGNLMARRTTNRGLFHRNGKEKA